MTWEDIIIKIRTQPEFDDLVEKAYFHEDLVLNVNRFKSSDEYAETKKIIQQYCKTKSSTKLLDIGSGNGISCVSFALDGYMVTSVEPDKSETIGNGAIRSLKNIYQLSNLTILDSYGEQLPLETESFDVVYIRQAMHHANDLGKFIQEAARVLKKGGLLLTVRDHVIYNEKDKQWFLENHPLHKFYGGENAFTLEEYTAAMKHSGLKTEKVLKHFDSIINYFPMTDNEVKDCLQKREQVIVNSLNQKLPSLLSKNNLVKKLYARYLEQKIGKALDESSIPGRIYSFIATKPA